MKIKEMKDGMSNVNIEASVFDKSGKVANVLLEDETGRIKASLWGRAK